MLSIKSRKIVSFASLAALGLSLAGCFDSESKMVCDKKDESFFRQSIVHYFEKKGEPEKASRMHLEEGARYSKNTNWWVVPFTLNGELYNALVSCDGQLELTKP